MLEMVFWAGCRCHKEPWRFKQCCLSGLLPCCIFRSNFYLRSVVRLSIMFKSTIIDYCYFHVSNVLTYKYAYTLLFKFNYILFPLCRDITQSHHSLIIIFTLNCRGLNHALKLRVQNPILKTGGDIFLQETHLRDDKHPVFKSPKNQFQAPGTSKARRVAILFSARLRVTVKQQRKVALYSFKLI